MKELQLEARLTPRNANIGPEYMAMDASWAMVSVMGYGNSLRIHLPITPLVELTAYQHMQRNTIRTPSRISPAVRPDMMNVEISFPDVLVYTETCLTLKILTINIIEVSVL